ncbi:porin [Paraburkholderia sacchari]|uniref:porin n=1 Tax=Paraburkholderia sacchari TaxID=159450 RepID=UPI001BCB7539|nr:porin [Paraburkholderia sacchari]
MGRKCGKCALAAMIGLAAPIAHAQSSVTIFGLLDAGVSYISNQGGKSNLQMADGIAVPNLFGMEGTEDLGGGLKAKFRLVNQFSLGNGSIIASPSNSSMTSGGLFAREAWMGLASDRYGSLTMGRQQDFMVDTLLADVGADSALYVGGLYNFRDGPFSGLNLPDSPPNEAYNFDHMNGAEALSNSVKYTSANYSGLKFGGMYAFGGTAGNISQNSASSYGVSYARGPLAVGAAYTNVKYAVLEGESIRNWGAGMRYSIGGALLTLLYTNTRNTQNGAAVNMIEAGGTYRVTPAFGLGANYMYMWGNAGVDNNHAHQINAVAQYSLSKRTTVYAGTSYQIANAGATAAIDGTFGPSSSNYQFVGRVGIQTRF